MEKIICRYLEDFQIAKRKKTADHDVNKAGGRGIWPTACARSRCLDTCDVGAKEVYEGMFGNIRRREVNLYSELWQW